MARADRKRGRGDTRAGAAPRTAAPRGGSPSMPAVPLSHPAMAVAVLATAAAVLTAITFRIYDTDFWQHLLVGKFIWETHRLPTLQLWTWPTYGTPDVNASWGFRALVWPFWSLGGVWGLFVWRWLTTLAAFGILWALGRRMGARGFAALGIVLMCVLVYRLRTQIRPETLVAVLLAIELWVLETRRLGGRDRAFLLVPIAWAWANAHISWYLGFVVSGIYLLDALVRAARGRDDVARPAWRLGVAILAAFAISFVYPWGWTALWQAFEYFLHWRHEPIFQFIVELQPVKWSDYQGTPFSILVPLWPGLILFHLIRRRFDLVEVLLCAGFTALAIATQRFVGIYALVAVPFLMRGVAGLMATLEAPAWLARPAARAGIVALLCALVAVAEARRPDPPIGVSMDHARYPIRACDFIARHEIRGRGFNNFEYGGYQAWRFWPDRERLPFIDVHQAGTRLDRRLYVFSFRSAEDWQTLDQERRFDYVLISRDRKATSRLPDILDADSAWALVFADDAATVWVRRSGPLAAVADTFAYRHLPGGTERLGPLGQATVTDPVLRAAVAAELERQVESSPWCSSALSLQANIAMSEARFDEARRLLERGLAIAPALGRAHERLGRMLLEEGKPQAALAEFERERLANPAHEEIAFLIGRAWRALGDVEKARAWYRRELARDPQHQEAADSLRALERTGS
jgi:tetratricopeptide (TPR) repeat protein